MTTNEENAGIPATTVAFLCEVFSTGIRRNWFPKLVDEGRGDRSYSSSSSLIVDPTITSISDNVIFAQDHLLECLQQLNDPAVVFLLENAHHFESVYNSCRNSMSSLNLPGGISQNIRCPAFVSTTGTLEKSADFTHVHAARVVCCEISGSAARMGKVAAGEIETELISANEVITSRATIGEMSVGDVDVDALKVNGFVAPAEPPAPEICGGAVYYVRDVSNSLPVGPYSNVLPVIKTCDNDSYIGNVMAAELPSFPQNNQIVVTDTAANMRHGIKRNAAEIYIDSEKIYSPGDLRLHSESGNIYMSLGGGTVNPQSVVVEGNLYVEGTTFSTDYEAVTVAENIILLNRGYIGTAITSAGLAAIVNIADDPEVPVYIDEAGFVEGDLLSNPPHVFTLTDPTLNFSVGDIVQVSSTPNNDNTGIYQILSFGPGNRINISWVKAATLTFVQRQFTTSSYVGIPGPYGRLDHVNAIFMGVNDLSGRIEFVRGNNSSTVVRMPVMQLYPLQDDIQVQFDGVSAYTIQVASTSAADSTTSIIAGKSNYSADIDLSSADRSVRFGKTSTTPWGWVGAGEGLVALGYDTLMNPVSSAAGVIAIGENAGRAQNTGAIAIGHHAVAAGQGARAIAIGEDTAQTAQGTLSVAIGFEAGKIGQGASSVAVGTSAGKTTQKAASVAIGGLSGMENQGNDSVAVGYSAGNISQGNFCVAVGDQAGNNSQSDCALAVGTNAGRQAQRTEAVAVGYEAGDSNQGAYSVAVGGYAGMTSQGEYAIAIGRFAGQITQGEKAIAIGHLAGNSDQLTGSVAIGWGAASFSQSARSVAVGHDAGNSSQADNCVATGYLAGSLSQKSNSVAVGSNAGSFLQGTSCVAVGAHAGEGLGLTDYQHDYSVAIGAYAGYSDQKTESVAVGYQAGYDAQDVSCVAVGVRAGLTLQQQYCVAIGADSGQTSQGDSSIAIGNLAGRLSQGAHSISIGDSAAEDNQGTQSIALGQEAGKYSQGAGAIGLGYQAGIGGPTANTFQGVNAVAVGYQAARIKQGSSSIAIGQQSAEDNQGTQSIALGQEAGRYSQGAGAISLGFQAGTGSTTANTFQGVNAVAVGYQAARIKQGSSSIAIGQQSAEREQNADAIAIGSLAGRFSQGLSSIAIGTNAATGTSVGVGGQGAGAIAIGNQAAQVSQGAGAIAIGQLAGGSNQPADSICLGRGCAPPANAGTLAFGPNMRAPVSASAAVVQGPSAFFDMEYRGLPYRVPLFPSNTTNIPSGGGGGGTSMKMAVGELTYVNITAEPGTGLYTTSNLFNGTFPNGGELLAPAFTLNSTTDMMGMNYFHSPLQGRIMYMGSITTLFHTAYSLSAKSGNGNQTIVFYLRKNGVTVNNSIYFFRTDTGGNYFTVAAHVVIQLAPGDYVEVWAQNITANNQLSFRNLNFVIIGDGS